MSQQFLIQRTDINVDSPVYYNSLSSLMWTDNPDDAEPFDSKEEAEGLAGRVFGSRDLPYQVVPKPEQAPSCPV